MKIKSIQLGAKRNTASDGETSENFEFYLFKVPVVYGFGAVERVVSSNSAIIFSPEYRQHFRSANSFGIKYDKVVFHPTPTDRQYISSIGLPVDKPVILEDYAAISDILRNMNTAYGTRTKRTAELMELYMRIIFLTLCDILYEKEEKDIPNIPRYEQLRALREAIYSDPVRKWSVEEICSEMNVSRAYFHRIYQSAFGITCGQDIISGRLSYAADLLENTEMSVSLIAEKCGYDSDSYFMRQFRKHKGCTPSEYRRRKQS